jgi:hypothetical protein
MEGTNFLAQPAGKFCRELATMIITPSFFSYKDDRIQRIRRCICIRMMRLKGKKTDNTRKSVVKGTQNISSALGDLQCLKIAVA